jgi:hypothetical protein
MASALQSSHNFRGQLGRKPLLKDVAHTRSAKSLTCGQFYWCVVSHRGTTCDSCDRLKARHQRPVLLSSFIKASVKRKPTTATDSEQMARIARRVCWWQSAEVTVDNTPLFLCRVMVFGTWDDVCFVIDKHGKASFREALQSAPPGLFDNRSWHYWHHRLKLLPVPALPQRVIPA